MERKKTSNEAPKRRGAKGKKSVPVKAIAIIAGIVVLVIGIFCLLFFGCSGRAKDIYVENINVTGKNYEQIKEELKKLEGAFDDSSVTVFVSGIGDLKTITANDIGLKFNLEKTAEAAYNASTKKRIVLGKRIDVECIFDYDNIALRNITEEITKNGGGDLHEHEIIVEEERVVIKSGKSGTGVSARATAEAVIKSFKPHEGTKIEVKMEKTEPKAIDIDELYEATKQEVSDAQYKYENGAVVISDEVDGREIDKEDARAKLENFKEGSEDVYIDFKITPATVKKSQLQARLFKDVLGEYSSKYNAGNINRTTNVEMAAKYINGKVLLPGEIFSYNETVGPRTYERGFRVASVYEANRVADGMGGGICQTCSTLYPAVLYADLEVIERTNHSLEVNYVPLGMDATVAWNSLDFKFKNSTSSPIKITTTYGGGAIRVKIIGTKDNPSKTIKIVTERTSYTPFTVKEVEDPALEPGARVNVSNGFNGSTVNTYKVYYENGVEVKRVNLGRSTYRMAEKVVNIGPALEEQPPADGGEGVTTPEVIPTTPQPSQVPGSEATQPPSQPVESQTPTLSPLPTEAPITQAEIAGEYPEGI